MKAGLARFIALVGVCLFSLAGATRAQTFAAGELAGRSADDPIANKLLSQWLPRPAAPGGDLAVNASNSPYNISSGTQTFNYVRMGYNNFTPIPTDSVLNLTLTRRRSNT